MFANRQTALTSGMLLAGVSLQFEGEQARQRQSTATARAAHTCSRRVSLFQEPGQVAPFILGVERDIMEHPTGPVDLFTIPVAYHG